MRGAAMARTGADPFRGRSGEVCDSAAFDANLRVRAMADTVSRLAANADFRKWLRATLDDLCAYSRDEGPLTDFGQGIRASAARIENRLLASEEAVEMLADFARADYAAEHERQRRALDMDNRRKGI